MYNLKQRERPRLGHGIAGICLARPQLAKILGKKRPTSATTGQTEGR